ncbi:hypothetical protein Pmani_033197 [Petrolisthes manimaculis]|uniref:Uncharacterized protein n=1 Tax=Petrolisthes manimaculis TaxID=1843537 RepID=A0AAE1NQY9_9EUCA|nr:hypothetical protein Pmani_033197 [Petrolisthes manimaculis]
MTVFPARATTQPTNHRSQCGGGSGGSGGGTEAPHRRMYRKSIDMSRGNVGETNNNTNNNMFGVSPDQLRSLMEARGSEGVQTLREQFGTVEDLCQRLHSHPTEERTRKLAPKEVAVEIGAKKEVAGDTTFKLHQ